MCMCSTWRLGPVVTSGCSRGTTSLGIVLSAPPSPFQRCTSAPPHAGSSHSTRHPASVFEQLVMRAMDFSA
jgi:hypothetical protein